MRCSDNHNADTDYERPYQHHIHVLKICIDTLAQHLSHPSRLQLCKPKKVDATVRQLVTFTSPPGFARQRGPPGFPRQRGVRRPTSIERCHSTAPLRKLGALSFRMRASVTQVGTNINTFTFLSQLHVCVEEKVSIFLFFLAIQTAQCAVHTKCTLVRNCYVVWLEWKRVKKKTCVIISTE